MGINSVEGAVLAAAQAKSARRYSRFAVPSAATLLCLGTRGTQHRGYLYQSILGEKLTLAFIGARGRVPISCFEARLR
jgi:hypothetical protein